MRYTAAQLGHLIANSLQPPMTTQSAEAYCERADVATRNHLLLAAIVMAVEVSTRETKALATQVHNVQLLVQQMLQRATKSNADTEHPIADAMLAQLKPTIDEIDFATVPLSRRAVNCLQRAGITRRSQISQAKLEAQYGCGLTTTWEIMQWLGK
jgi:DNA-directed RNA polymerase alpha subunit